MTFIALHDKQHIQLSVGYITNTKCTGTGVALRTHKPPTAD